MKKFLKNIGIFIVLLVAINLIFLVAFRIKLHLIRIPENISIVMCGDSHALTSLNDSIIPGSINIAQSSEHYFYTYNELKILIKNSKNIKTILLGYSFHSFMADYDLFLFDSVKLKTMLPRYFAMLDAASISVLIKNNKMDINDNSSLIYKGILNSLFQKHSSIHDYEFIGEFEKRYKSRIDTNLVNKRILGHYYKENGELQDFSPYQQIFLDKIVDLCHDKHIRLILINTPLSMLYRNKVPEKFIAKYYSKVEDYGKKIELFDLNSLPLENKYFYDGDHLNYYGSIPFSTYIDSLLNNRNN